MIIWGEWEDGITIESEEGKRRDRDSETEPWMRRGDPGLWRPVGDVEVAGLGARGFKRERNFG
jgi:hypothetical protein